MATHDRRCASEVVATVLPTISALMDVKDPYTAGHSGRVARFAVQLAQDLGETGDQLERVYLAGLLHDVGKIGLPARVLRKTGGLTEHEWVRVRSHPEVGHDLLRGIEPLAGVLPAVRHHHERWDGEGYPDRLAGERIPRIARIMAVADALDAMTSDRPYRGRLPADKVSRIFRDGAARQWDAEVVEAAFRARLLA